MVDYLTILCLIQNPEFDSKCPVRNKTQMIIQFDTVYLFLKQCIVLDSIILSNANLDKLNRLYNCAVRIYNKLTNKILDF